MDKTKEVTELAAQQPNTNMKTSVVVFGCIALIVGSAISALGQKILVGKGELSGKRGVLVGAYFEDQQQYYLQQATSLGGPWTTFHPHTNGAIGSVAIFREITNKTSFFRCAQPAIPPGKARIDRTPFGDLHEGDSIVISAVVTGSHPMWYFFYRNGSVVKASTDQRLVLSGTMGDSGMYSAVCSNAFGLVSTSAISVVVLPPVPDLAPEIIAGRVIVVTVVGGTAPFARSGSYTFKPAANRNSYFIEGDGERIPSSFGTYEYRKTGPNEAHITFDDSIVGAGASALLTFETDSTGEYVLSARGGRQIATFQIAK